MNLLTPCCNAKIKVSTSWLGEIEGFFCDTCKNEWYPNGNPENINGQWFENVDK